MRIYPSVFFLGVGAFSTGQSVPAAVDGTNGGCGPVLVLHFLDVAFGVHSVLERLPKPDTM